MVQYLIFGRPFVIRCGQKGDSFLQEGMVMLFRGVYIMGAFYIFADYTFFMA